MDLISYRPFYLHEIMHILTFGGKIVFSCAIFFKEKCQGKLFVRKMYVSLQIKHTSINITDKTSGF